MVARRPSRPKVKLTSTWLDILLVAAGLLFLVWEVIFTGLSWSHIPDKVPSHFGPSGQPDSYGGKWNLIAVPIVQAVFFIALYVLSRFPHIFNYPVTVNEENARRLYRIGKTAVLFLSDGITLLLGLIQWSLIRVSLGQQAYLNRWWLVVLFFVVILIPMVMILFMIRAWRAAS